MYLEVALVSSSNSVIGLFLFSFISFPLVRWQICPFHQQPWNWNTVCEGPWKPFTGIFLSPMRFSVFIWWRIKIPPSCAFHSNHSVAILEELPLLKPVSSRHLVNDPVGMSCMMALRYIKALASYPTIFWQAFACFPWSSISFSLILVFPPRGIDERWYKGHPLQIFVFFVKQREDARFQGGKEVHQGNTGIGNTLP